MFLDQVKRGVLRHDGEVVTSVLVGEVKRKEIVIGLAQHFRRGTADPLPITRIAERETPFAVFAKDTLRHRFNQRAVKGFTLAQLGLLKARGIAFCRV